MEASKYMKRIKTIFFRLLAIIYAMGGISTPLVANENKIGSFEQILDKPKEEKSFEMDAHEILGRTNLTAHVIVGNSTGQWEADGDCWYFLLSNGSYATGWHTINNKTYYFYEDYIERFFEMATGPVKVLSGQVYFFDNSGVWQKKVGWYQSNSEYGYYSNWYYMNSEGELQTGWQKINNKWYYFDGLGRMQTGLIIDETGNSYFMETNGVWETKQGWYRLTPFNDGQWTYVLSNGKTSVGWQKINNKWYYFDASGRMQTGPIVDNVGNYYLLNNTGVWINQAGWHNYYDTWYYVKSNGMLQTGWIQIANQWFYFYEFGVMASNQVAMIDGQKYFFDKNGVLHSRIGWLKLDNSWYYFDANKTIITGWYDINNYTYYFDEFTGEMATGVRFVDGYLELFDDNGAWLGTLE